MTEIKETEAKDKISYQFPKDLMEKVKSAANYCFSCNRCVNVCPPALLGIFNPRNLITDLTFLTPEEALKNNNIWKCLTCGLCSIYCPMTKDKVGVNIPNIIKELRSLTADYKFLQDEKLICHHDRTYSSLPFLMANDKIKIANKNGFLDDTSLKVKNEGEPK